MSSHSPSVCWPYAIALRRKFLLQNGFQAEKCKWAGACRRMASQADPPLAAESLQPSSECLIKPQEKWLKKLISYCSLYDRLLKMFWRSHKSGADNETFEPEGWVTSILINASWINYKHQKPWNWEVKLQSSSWTVCAHIKSSPESEARGYSPACCAWQRHHSLSGSNTVPLLLPFLLPGISLSQAQLGASLLDFQICFVLWWQLSAELCWK